MALTAVFMGLIMTAGGGRAEHFLTIGSFVVGISSLFCWVSFSKCIAERFIGPSRVLLILAYPMIQAVLVFVTFFGGCLLMLQTKGFH